MFNVFCCLLHRLFVNESCYCKSAFRKYNSLHNLFIFFTKHPQFQSVLTVKDVPISILDNVIVVINLFLYTLKVNLLIITREYTRHYDGHSGVCILGCLNQSAMFK